MIFDGITCLVFPYTVKMIIDRVSGYSNESFLSIIIQSVALLIMVLMVARLRKGFQTKLTKNILVQLKQKILENAMKNNNLTSEYISILTNDMNLYEQDYLNALFD